MISFHGKQEIKDLYLNRVRAHRMADEIIKGTYWEKGKGCAVGCTIHSDSHSAYETELGIPRILARLEDGIFEALPNKLAMTWPERFLESIPVGMNLKNIWPKFAIWLFIDEKYGVIQFCKFEKQKYAILKVADLYTSSLGGTLIDSQTWADAAVDAVDAADAADAANNAAAYAAADVAAYAADAADAAAVVVANAANAAAYAADAADAVYAKRTEWRIAQSEKLLQLFREEK